LPYNDGVEHRWGIGLALTLTLLLPSVSLGQRRTHEAPVHFPRDNIPDRKPLPGDIETPPPAPRTTKPSGPGFWSAVTGTASQSTEVVGDWHRWLSQRMPPAVAWAVLALPIHLLLLLVLLVWRRRRAQRRATLSATLRVTKNPLVKPPVAPAAASREEKVIAPLQHSPAERLLLHGETSMHEAFAVQGADEDALRVLHDCLTRSMDDVTWAAAISGEDPGLLRPLVESWTKALAAHRLKAWLKDTPLVAQAALQVNMPDLHQPSEVENVTLSLASGLGADLTPAQEELLQRTRSALQQVWQTPLPHALIVVARRSRLPVLLGDPDLDPLALALVLHGRQALTHAAPAQANPVGLSQEFVDALASHHHLVDTPVGGTGPVVHALVGIGGGKFEGIGTLCASVAGAAFSTMAVTLAVSKVVARLGPSQKESCQRLGQTMAPLIHDEQCRDGAVFRSNLHRMLGGEVLEQAAARAEQLLHLARRLNRQPLWSGSSEAPDLTLLQLHHTLVQHGLQQSHAAQRRMLDILAQLAYEGLQQKNLTLANCRLGYVVAGLGMSLLRSTGTDLLSAAREAIAGLGG